MAVMYNARQKAAKGRATRTARSLARFARLQQLSDEDFSKADAAEILGMKVGGLENLLTKKVGSKVWPIVNARILP